MRLRTVFLVCFAVSCLPALIWPAQSAMRGQSAWSNARQAVRAAVAMGDALRLVEALSIERGALQERALSDNPGLENLSKIAAANDTLLDQMQASLLSSYTGPY